ncbi:hypothetical protein COY87_02145 [Candidatus Roizmanbacteria bacterium CG_4_10_14_0_8_um_filter_33_9]|uniref:Regulatory protein RecX n=1 Tax=Candidatus Roizmanbacteria bacterium CG_4_10_14_0_8_um_filter_33_9 TaxID=1974826 RepID=A0A2M7QK35_9BACT|nr:MAG: hypothetical protein COY87_02145 [Candidatus Roizmanbacteria bacterium CG_4_10_14_0_8_um_filter_33_9]
MSDSFSQALNLAYFFLKFRLRTEKEIVKYLERKKNNFTPEIIEKVVTQLKEQGYVDDEKFIKLFVTQRNKLKPKSAFALSRELQQLGVDRDLIDAFFEQNPEDETNLAFLALQKKQQTFSRLDPKTRFKKAISFLLRRGFSYEIAKKTYYLIWNSLDNINTTTRK